MAKRRSVTRQWVRRQASDPYVRQRDAAGFRSRAAFKLKEILDRDRLLRKGGHVLDIGASPGGWSQIAAQAVGPAGTVVAVDRLAMEPLSGVTFIQGDCLEEETLTRIHAAFGERKADLVMSDIAPNITGIRDLDEANFLALADIVRSLAEATLRRDGALLVKLFQFPGTDAFVTDLKSVFTTISRRKPDSSRRTSREFYVVARGFVI